MPLEIFRVNPIGVVESKYSKQKCLIVYLSAPHNDPNNVSLNDLIDKSEFSLQYVTIDQAIKLIKHIGRVSWLCKTDISDGVDPKVLAKHLAAFADHLCVPQEVKAVYLGQCLGRFKNKGSTQ